VPETNCMSDRRCRRPALRECVSRAPTSPSRRGDAVNVRAFYDARGPAQENRIWKCLLDSRSQEDVIHLSITSVVERMFIRSARALPKQLWRPKTIGTSSSRVAANARRPDEPTASEAGPESPRQPFQ